MFIGAAVCRLLLSRRIILRVAMNETNERLLLTTQFRPTPWGDHTIMPEYGGGSITSVPRFIERALGLKPDQTPLNQAVEELPSYDRIMLFILDGIGYRRVLSLFDAHPDLILRALGERGWFFPLTSVFPSTTVAALASLSTGMTPLEHGLIGYRLYLRETSSITNMIRFSLLGSRRSDAAFDAGLDPERLLPGPTFHERLQQHRVAAHTLLPQTIVGSGLSKALYKGSKSLHPVAGLSDMLVIARQLLQKAKSKTFLSLYWPGLDTIAHIRGPETDAYVAELRAVDDAIRRELVGRVDQTLFIFTSDHGFVPMSPHDYIQLRDDDGANNALLLPPVGEPRASYFFTRNGETERVARFLAEKHEDGLVCLDPNEILSAGLLGTGTPHPEIENRLGDLVAVSTGRAGIFHPYPDATMLRGMHGGLTEDEMLVPFIVSPL